MSQFSIMECILPFIIGGLVVGITVSLVKHLSPRTGAMFYALPITFIIAIILLYQEPDKISEFAKESIPAGLCIFLFMLIFAIVFHYNEKKIWSSIMLTILIWLVLAILIFKFRNQF